MKYFTTTSNLIKHSHNADVENIRILPRRDQKLKEISAALCFKKGIVHDSNAAIVALIIHFIT